MDQATHNKIVSFIWGIADDVLRDLFKRGKYPDVILPMCVLRRMDAVLEPTKKAVLETKEMLDKAGITEQRAALCRRRRPVVLQHLPVHPARPQIPRQPAAAPADFEDYLNGFSPNVQDILENFKFRNQLSTLSKSDSLGTLIDKFLDPGNQPQPRSRPQWRRHGEASRPWTTTPWARSSRNWSASSTRRTTRRPASTGRPATPSG